MTTFRAFAAFGYGTAGITCFLLEYVRWFKDSAAQETAEKALRWLIQQGRKKNTQLTWPLFPKSQETGQGLNDGSAGIALTFIKAYELLQRPAYRQTAEAALSSYSSFMIGRELTLANGLAGIGETYLEAARVFNSQKWYERADWIVKGLQHHYRLAATDACYWLVDQSPFSTADFMIGNSGIIHFLLRCAQPSKLSHPLFYF